MSPIIFFFFSMAFLIYCQAYFHVKWLGAYRPTDFMLYIVFKHRHYCVNYECFTLFSNPPYNFFPNDFRGLLRMRRKSMAIRLTSY